MRPLNSLARDCVPRVAVMALLFSLPPVAVSAPWLAPGDLSMRHDIELLADSGVIPAPITTWPMSWPDIARAVSREEHTEALLPAVADALARVQRAARIASQSGLSETAVRASAAREPLRLRTFSDTPREEGEVGLETGWVGGRWAVNVNAAVVADPADDQKVRLDGSYVGVTLGNVMISAGSVERWWGPGWEGSLILSTNARPIPGITIERNYTDAFQTKLLSWLGPWRASASLGQEEGSDVALADVRFFAARVNFRPRPWLEIGLSRTAQWCGEGRPCDLETFGDLLRGRDNRSDALTEAQEPGNQMAGYDFRLRSPWRAVPLAVYGQLIGEDEAGGLPSKLLGLMGAQTWAFTRWGSIRMHAEFADTSCNFSRETPEFGCAYRNGLYPQGYTYRRRTIGHALGADGRMVSLGALLVRSNGDSLSALLRRSDLNRGGASQDEAGNPIARSVLKNVELQYNRAFARAGLGLGVGLDDHDGPSASGSDVRVFLRWRQGF